MTVQENIVGRVWINEHQYFDGVPQEVWEFRIGGYQVLKKWLMDRRGQNLSSAEIEHFQQIVAAIDQTIKIMAKIDDLISVFPLP